jgi:''Cold-shock'' DNA-binding domain.
VNAPAVLTSRLTGRVESFDAHRGTGTVIDDAGDVYPFHCTAIADGSRAVEPGTRVTFEVTPGLGRWEAAALAPLSP